MCNQIHEKANALFHFVFPKTGQPRFQGLFRGLGAAKSPWDHGCKPVANLIDAFVIYFVKSHVAGLTVTAGRCILGLLREKCGAFKHTRKQFSSLNKQLVKHSHTCLRPQLYGLGYPRQPSPQATLGELAFHCVVGNVKQLFI